MVKKKNRETLSETTNQSKEKITKTKSRDTLNLLEDNSK